MYIDHQRFCSPPDLKLPFRGARELGRLPGCYRSVPGPWARRSRGITMLPNPAEARCPRRAAEECRALGSRDRRRPVVFNCSAGTPADRLSAALGGCRDRDGSVALGEVRDWQDVPGWRPRSAGRPRIVAETSQADRTARLAALLGSCLWLSSRGSPACLVPCRVARTSACAASGKRGASHDHLA